jgi:hypothetical protein
MKIITEIILMENPKKGGRPAIEKKFIKKTDFCV